MKKGPNYTVMPGDWHQLEIIINDLTRILTTTVDTSAIYTTASDAYSLASAVSAIAATQSELDVVSDALSVHKANVGTDHSYIDQDVTQTATPTFADIKLGGPFVDVRTYSTFSDAIDGIGASEKTLLISGSQAVTGNKNIPANITLLFLKGGSLNISSGRVVTFTYGCDIIAGVHQQIFTGDGTVSEVYYGSVKWWGATGDGATNDQPAMQKAVNSMATGGTLYFPNGSYVNSTVSQTVEIKTQGLTLIGESRGGVNICLSSTHSGFTVGNNALAGGEIFGDNESIVSNGSFTTDTSDWTGTDCTLASVAGGESGNCLEITRTDGTEQYASQTLTTEADRWYCVTVWVKSGTSGDEAFYIEIHDAGGEVANLTGISDSDWREYRFSFLAREVSTDIRLGKNTATAGTMLFDTVSSYSLTSDVTIRNFNFKGVAGTGGLGVWLAYAKNCYVENISFQDALCAIAVGNDSVCDCYDIAINGVYCTGNISHASWYSVGLFRTTKATLTNLLLTSKGGAEQFLAHDCLDIHVSNLVTRYINGIEITRSGRCTITNFSIEGGSEGIVTNYESDVNTSRWHNIFSNGVIRNADKGIRLYGYLDTFSNIITKDCTTSLYCESGSMSHMFIACHFTENSFGGPGSRTDNVFIGCRYGIGSSYDDIELMPRIGQTVELEGDVDVDSDLTVGGDIIMGGSTLSSVTGSLAVATSDAYSLASNAYSIAYGGLITNLEGGDADDTYTAIGMGAIDGGTS